MKLENKGKRKKKIIVGFKTVRISYEDTEVNRTKTKL